MPLELPWELRLTLRPGTVYYFIHRGLNSPEPYYFVVVNSKPMEDQMLVLAVASSKIAAVKQRRRTMPLGTLVEIGPAEYREFSMPSIVDCNRVFGVSLG